LDIFGDFISWVTQLMVPYMKMPASTIFTFLLSFTLSIVSTGAMRLGSDIKKYQEYMAEINAYYKELREAQSKGDKEKLSRLKRKEARISTLQRATFSNRFKVTAVFFVPFLVIFWMLNTVYKDTIVAVAPFWIPLIGKELSFTSWYFICSLSMSTLLYKLFGLMPETE